MTEFRKCKNHQLLSSWAQFPFEYVCVCVCIYIFKYIYRHTLGKILCFPTVRQLLSEKTDQVFFVHGRSRECQHTYKNLGKVQRAGGLARRAKLCELTTVKQW